ncbi:MAG: hypothetical protein ACYDEQ_05475 [Desulfocucumaceae bacterium]
MKKWSLIILLAIVVASGNNAFAQLKVDANGNVGIGTSTPLAKLNVDGWTVLNPHDVPNTEGGHLWLLGAGTNAAWSIDVKDDRFRIYSSGGFNQNGTERMVIKSNGNVGIGTSTPQNILDVNGDVKMRVLKLSPETTSVEGGQINFAGAGTNPTWYADVYNKSFRLHCSDSSRFEVDSSGVTTINNLLVLKNRNSLPQSPQTGTIVMYNGYLYWYTGGGWRKVSSTAYTEQQ